MYPLRLRNGVTSARNPSLIPPKQDYAPFIRDPTNHAHKRYCALVHHKIINF